MGTEHCNVSDTKKPVNILVLAEPQYVVIYSIRHGARFKQIASPVIATDDKQAPPLWQLIIHKSQTIQEISVTFVLNEVCYDGQY